IAICADRLAEPLPRLVPVSRRDTHGLADVAGRDADDVADMAGRRDRIRPRMPMRVGTGLTGESDGGESHRADDRRSCCNVLQFHGELLTAGNAAATSADGSD